MATRTYGQYCGVALALDIVGERWTMLILREVLLGPRRFSDLLDALPGLSTGLLTARLRALESEGLLRRRRLAPPAASAVYELTDAGRELEPVVLGLARFGGERLGPRDEDLAFRPQWAMLAIRANHDPDAAQGVEAVYQFDIGDDAFHVIVHDGTLEVHDGSTRAPVVRVVSDPDTFARVASDPGSAPLDQLRVEGSRQDVRRMLRIISPSRRPKPAP